MEKVVIQGLANPESRTCDGSSIDMYNNDVGKRFMK
jgi:hypothetical protein